MSISLQSESEFIDVMLQGGWNDIFLRKDIFFRKDIFLEVRQHSRASQCFPLELLAKFI
jgi:hypothetical protein